MSVYQRGSLPVDDMSVLVNGTPISSYGLWVTSAAMEIASGDPSTDMVEVPGRESVDLSLEDVQGAAIPERRTITLHVRTVGDESDIVSTKIRAGSLHGMTGSIRWRNLPGDYEGRISIGAWTDAYRHGRLATAETDITFNAAPYLIGTVERVQKIQSGVPTLVRVEGNRPAPPVWTLTPDSGVTQVTISDDRGDSITVNPATEITGIIVIDCAAQTARIAGNLAPVTIDSDYFALTSPYVRISVQGASGTVSYRPRTYI